MKVVKDFFTLEFSLRRAGENRASTYETGTRDDALPGDENNTHKVTAEQLETSTEGGPFPHWGNGWPDKAPTSPLQVMLTFTTATPGELPSFSVLEPYCKVLERALKPEAAVSSASSSSSTGESGVTLGTSPSEVSTASGDNVVSRCQLDDALVCLDTDGSGAVEFDEFLAASMTRVDFLEREPACRYNMALYRIFRPLDRCVCVYLRTCAYGRRLLPLPCSDFVFCSASRSECWTVTPMALSLQMTC